MERQTGGGEQPVLLMAGCLAWFQLIQGYFKYKQQPEELLCPLASSAINITITAKTAPRIVTFIMQQMPHTQPKLYPTGASKGYTPK